MNDTAESPTRQPAPLAGSAPLTASERRRTALAAVAPVVLVAVALVPVAAWTGAGVGDVLAAAVVYGGLLGLAAGFVYVDRVHARQCPRCTTRNPGEAEVCRECGYDLESRPRFSCSEGHRIYVEPGLCACGRRLQHREVARGVGPELVFILRIGGWLLAFLLVVGVVLRLLE